MIEALLLSTRPAARPSLVHRGEVDVGLHRRRLLRPGDPEPAGRRERRDERREPALEVGSPCGADDDHVEVLRGPRQERHAVGDRRQRLQSLVEPLGRIREVDAGAGGDAELPPQRRRRVVLVRGHRGSLPALASGASLPRPHGTIDGMAGALFVVGTPIGNLGDASPRARETLGSVDLVAAEDTRRTGRLLQGFGIKAKLVSLFDGNERERTPETPRAPARRGVGRARVRRRDAARVRSRLPAGGRVHRGGDRGAGGAGPLGARRRARRERPADGALRVRGVRAEEGRRPDEAAGVSAERSADARVLRITAARRDAAARRARRPSATAASRSVGS